MAKRHKRKHKVESVLPLYSVCVYFGGVAPEHQAFGGSETQGRVAWTIFGCPVKVPRRGREKKESEGSSGWGGPGLCAAGRT